MTAAVAASYAAEAGVKLDDMGQKKVIKKKTRGFKVDCLPVLCICPCLVPA
jgi:hypothetical protein